MASQPTTAMQRGGITFAQPDFDDSKDESKDSKSDDDNVAGRKESNTSFLERIKSAPRAARNRFRLKDAEFKGPSHHMNPTSAKMSIAGRKTSTGDPIQDFEVMWRSRDNRKGSVAVPVSPRGGAITMRMVFSSKDTGRGLYRMLTFFPYWDMSFWSGWTYTVGSILFVIDGFFAWLPLAAPSTEFPGDDKYGVPLAFFFGALFYQVGAVMAYFEAINDGSFAGSAMKRLLLGHDKEAKEILDQKLSNFFGHIKPGHKASTAEEEREKREASVDPEAGWRAMNQNQNQTQNPTPRNRQSIYPGMRGSLRRGGLDMGEPEEGESVEYMQWRWWPTWHRLRTHHIYEIGYLSCTIQLVGVTLYGVTAIIILPGILDTFNVWQTNVGYWIPQIVASTCFLVASFGFMWETQVKWWKPEFGVLGWWIGFWSVVGSVGFLLCAVFGICSWTNTGLEYQSDLSTTWGSIAYLTGSALQWYEAVNKHSVSDLLDSSKEVVDPVQPLGQEGIQHTDYAGHTGQHTTSVPISTQQTPLSPMAERGQHTTAAPVSTQQSPVSPAAETGQQPKPEGHVREPDEIERQLTK